ncbi:calmodulin, striated muscle [Cajanus cajan]|uniref:EF-hand domain-containing protein n=1 Tax=Cajanus cajan TaxID=3821 RepID=A0A151S815_CAJCA|nr:calmodulin, striated muscle [Cajanus cajan]KYP50907.1 hypothetical protein KK1_027263 [Cajanus cajan]
MPVFIPKRMPEFNTKGMPQNMIEAEKHIREILKKADGDGDGYLSKNDLKKAFKEFGSKLPAWRACHCLRKADTNNDGLVGGIELDIVVDYALAKYKFN